MTTFPGAGVSAPDAPPPWPIPLSWAPESPSGESADAEVAVIDLRTVPAESLTLEDAHELAQMVEGAGGPGVVVMLAADAVPETVWALELISTVDRPVVVVGAEQIGRDAGDPPDLPAASLVAASGADLGCVVVADSQIHAARYVQRSGGRFVSAPLGPMGRLAGEVLHLTGHRERTRVRGPFRRPLPRVGHYSASLGDDGSAARELARPCAGLVVEAVGARTLPAGLTPVLAELAEHIPVVVVTQTGIRAGGELVTVPTLDATKARILMAFLLAAGHDLAAVLAVFARLAAGGTLETGPAPGLNA
jgi:L-asparaginase